MAATRYIRWSIIVFVLIASGILIHSFVKDKEVQGGDAHKATVQVPVEKLQEPTEADSEISGKYYGLCAKNSIRSVKDFRSTVENDPVLARHFEGFNWQTAHLGKQDNDVWTYVSYRKDEMIMRTSKPVRLPKGDGYITDGTRMVRTFCCNDYIAAPPPGKANPGPSERVDGPPRRIAGPVEGTPADPVSNPLPPPIDKSLESFPTSYTPTFFGGGGGNGGNGGNGGFGAYSSGTKPNDTITATPEPSTFILLIAGITVIAFLGGIPKRLGARSQKDEGDFNN